MHVVLIEFRDSTPYPVHLANALAELCQVTLMLPKEGLRFADNLDREKVDLRIFHMPKLRQPTNLAMVWRLHRQLKAMHPDLLHITYWHLWANPGLGMFASLPLVATVHDVKRHSGERGVWAVPPALYAWQWRWADRVIVHATSERQQLVTQHGYPSGHIHVIPIGSYDFYRCLAGTEESSPHSERPNTILFFGRIWGYKGLQVLIEAEPLITQAVPDARIIIAGQGEPFEKYRRAMANPDRFEVYNHHIPDHQVAEFFQQASVIALPYVEASQSGVASVAYAFGKPVVATQVGGLPDIVKDGQTGMLVPPADARSLADAIVTLLKDTPLRRQMGEHAREFADTELSWQRVAQKTLDVYQELVNGS